MTDAELIDSIYQIAKAEKEAGNLLVDNLTSRFSVKSYLDIAKEIKACMPKGRILDWGCGFGHMSYLLKQLGLDVVSYDVQDSTQNPILKKLDVHPVVSSEQTKLPFADNSFDAVLSCGVLEHVQNEAESLLEVRRVVKKDGFFFVYRLPNKYSFAEALADIRKQSVHPVKYTLSSIKKLLKNNGFSVLKAGRENIIPKNLSFMPARVKALFNYHIGLWSFAESLLLHIPVLSLFCGALRIIAKKQ